MMWLVNLLLLMSMTLRVSSGIIISAVAVKALGLEAESARSRFRIEQEERYEARAEQLKSGASWKAWVTRLAGVPLVVLSVYLVVTHIAGG